MTNIDNINLIMKVTGTLSDFPINLKPENLEQEMWAHVNSKYSNSFKVKVLQEQTLGEGIACLTNVGNHASVTFFNLEEGHYYVPSLNDVYDSTQRFDIGNNDLIMFPTNIEYKVDGDGARLIIFQIDDLEHFGDGPNRYRVEVTFSDTYHINVNAKDEEDAKNIAYDINTSYWIHDWPKDKDLEKTQTTRVSKWGKKNLKAFKL